MRFSSVATFARGELATRNGICVIKIPSAHIAEIASILPLKNNLKKARQHIFYYRVVENAK